MAQDPYELLRIIRQRLDKHDFPMSGYEILFRNSETTWLTMIDECLVEAEKNPPPKTDGLRANDLYAVVRNNVGWEDEPTPYEWIDYSTISILPEEAMRKATEVNKTIPMYARQHPVMRTIRVNVVEAN